MCKVTSVIALSALVVIVSAQNAMLRGLPVADTTDKLLEGEYRIAFLESATKANMTQELMDFMLNFKKVDGEPFMNEVEQVYKEIEWNAFFRGIVKAFTELSTQFMEKSKDKKHLFELTNLITKFGIVKQ